MSYSVGCKPLAHELKLTLLLFVKGLESSENTSIDTASI